MSRHFNVQGGKVLKKNTTLQQMTLSALLIALGLIIPQVMPKIVIGPASFTLASHVPVLLAMFISPFAAVVVSLGTTLGFLLTGLPVIITLRALTHAIFAVIGAYYLQRYPQTVLQPKRFFIYNLVIALIHSGAELIVVTTFFTLGNLAETYYEQGYFVSIFLLLGLGGVIHSLIDYKIALYLGKALSKSVDLPVFSKAYGQQKALFAKASHVG